MQPRAKARTSAAFPLCSLAPQSRTPLPAPKARAGHLLPARSGSPRPGRTACPAGSTLAQGKQWPRTAVCSRQDKTPGGWGYLWGAEQRRVTPSHQTEPTALPRSPASPESPLKLAMSSGSLLTAPACPAQDDSVAQALRAALACSHSGPLLHKAPAPGPGRLLHLTRPFVKCWLAAKRNIF